MAVLALRSETGAILLPLALAFWGIHSGRGEAHEPRTFIITAGSGYGVEDCLDEGGECGRVVANAWCESHDHGTAVKFGRSPDDTDDISKAASVPKPYFITCEE
jgi:hypothetical protein